MAVMEAALRLREQGIDVVDFGPGEPDFSNARGTSSRRGFEPSRVNSQSTRRSRHQGVKESDRREARPGLRFEVRPVGMHRQLRRQARAVQCVFLGGG